MRHVNTRRQLDTIVLVASKMFPAKVHETELSRDEINLGFWNGKRSAVHLNIEGTNFPSIANQKVRGRGC